MPIAFATSCAAAAQASPLMPVSRVNRPLSDQIERRVLAAMAIEHPGMGQRAPGHVVGW
jgi:hypothetical protein